MITFYILLELIDGASPIVVADNDFSGRVFVNTAVGRMMGA